MHRDAENALLASPSRDGQKRHANSPASGTDKRPCVGSENVLKIVIKCVNGDVDDDFFDRLLLELSKMQWTIPSHEPQPCFKGSGHSLGVG